MNILDKIILRKQEEVTAAKRRIPMTRLEESEWFMRDCHSLKEFIKERSGIIAEFKRASPSKGIINKDAVLEQVVTGYAAAGASAISVLTDTDFFGGSKQDLLEARAFVDIPLLRKDFIIDEYQVVESKALGADIILLIAAVLSPESVQRLAILAKQLKLNVLLEIHNEQELDHICTEVDAVGVNNRNLKDFSISLDHSYRLVDKIPGRYMKISESGISDPAVIRELKAAGFNGFLVGENFMRTADPGAAMKEFVKQL